MSVRLFDCASVHHPAWDNTAPNGRIFMSIFEKSGVRGGVVVEALRYKPEGQWFDSRWCHWDFSLT
jgi:hypothetical protein